MSLTSTLREISVREQRLPTGVMIYALADPETRAIRYIGQTSTPGRRLKQHLRTRGKSDTSGINLWLASLRARGLTPCMLELEIVSDGDEGEVRWIAEYQRRGAQLLNMNSGGPSLDQCSQLAAQAARSTLFHREMEEMRRDVRWVLRHGSKEVGERLQAKYETVLQKIKLGEHELGKQLFRERFEAALVLRGETP